MSQSRNVFALTESGALRNPHAESRRPQSAFSVASHGPATSLLSDTSSIASSNALTESRQGGTGTSISRNAHGFVERVRAAQQRAARPSSALSRTTLGANEVAGGVWKRLEDQERQSYEASRRRSLLSAAQASAFDSATLQAGNSTNDRSREGNATPLKPLKWAAMMSYRTEAQVLDPEEMERRRQESEKTWNRLWKHKGVQAPVAYNSKRLGESPFQLIEKLRNDPEARRELDLRISREAEEHRRLEIEKRGDIQKKNRENVAKYASYFAQAKRATSALRLHTAIENAEAKRQGLQSWRTARTVDALQKADFKRQQREYEIEVELLSNSWATFVKAAVALCEMHDRMLEILRQAKSVTLRRYTYSGAVLQENIHARKTIRLVRASKVIWACWKLRRGKIRELKKQRAIDLVKRFFKDIGRVIRIPIAVKKKLHCVRMLQRRVRFRKQSFAFNLSLCMQQLDSALRKQLADDEAEVNRIRSNHHQYEREVNAKRGLHRLAKNEMVTEHREAADKQIGFLVRRQAAVASLPLEMKRELVHEFLLKKRSDFNNQVYRYGIALRFWYKAQMRAKEVIESEATDREAGTVSVGLRFEQENATAETAEELSRAVRRRTTHQLQKPLKPYLSTLFTKEEVVRLVNTAMDRMAQQEKKLAQEAALREAIERQKVVEAVQKKLQEGT
jgi:hypothetical protein